ncbi:ATP-binding cassette domain-containing protein [Roseospira marina]|uniref:ATP-binding cassette domain-containing protein n=1 Tax=Roseospira marina TaxID=140057 RepID=A0A5M6IDA1_9PROT|nr:ATP-binding cassette domain-containing protein [Roseospira marina]KAA5605598.1 ATP-binding cassette domain-containing protein [Roseospira marina]MBB4313334.1 putative thiamine transport system ATP-binding protein [Roseospira marina]MBB5085925.1 putative thiamine transport system ATP-binding protein [Roseospira marina]
MTLALEAVTLHLGTRRLLGPLSLAVAPGETVTVMGPSGSGKSTLLDAVAGTLSPAFRLSGRVTLDGRNLGGLPPERRRLGLLFQDPMLFPHLSVGGNLAFGIPRGVGRRARRARVAAALAEADLDGLEDRDPATLSGGQAARVALLRVLLAEPRALLLDEPFSRLDADLRARVRAFVFDHAAARGLPTVLVTHDPDDARGRILTVAEAGA